jgi:hypothetical protein
VVADTPYAEVEVMKMCMPLLLPASGVIHFVMPEGQAMKVHFLSLPLLACLLCYMEILDIALDACEMHIILYTS